MLLERRKSSYAEYRKTKSEMQDWLVAQKIVQEILKEDEQKKEQLHEQEVRDWGVPQQAENRFRVTKALLAAEEWVLKKSFKIWKNFRLILFVSWSRI